MRFTTCGAHTFQLAVSDALRSRQFQVFRQKLDKSQLLPEVPRLTASSRDVIKKICNSWSSHTLGFNIPGALRRFLKQTPPIKLSNMQWDQVSALEVLLRKPFVGTEKMHHEEDLSPGSLFKEWIYLLWWLSQDNLPVLWEPWKMYGAEIAKLLKFWYLASCRLLRSPE